MDAAADRFYILVHKALSAHVMFLACAGVPGRRGDMLNHRILLGFEQ